ncbi:MULTISPECIES: HlyD family efflux transporter periplasmic adaptor subunit [Planktothricoides]|uniref:HlyD family efflux transporter periplasmic adaptor subunit n=2 Tax=Planktothricoides raciborskii TaxID=132608 RepID=A0AAU8J9R8_9CYAN|nr:MULTISPECIES: HlyD family efflux transporter periplasmic adaptor subunit [Planktothricoides]MBD2543236.1 HlyD family efflux transporter periplasmic adaptor subunit [Planktothricoides raciborskii FACHB-1370]MBD2580849.1 HlyD family efflux transporter periplasmic adaptor subunit [Planktothricoides raciborskii FACHB-1261]
MNNHKSPPKLSSNGSSKNIHNYLMVDEARHERNGSGKIATYPTELITKSSEFPTDLTDDPVNIEETFTVDDRPFEVSEKPAAKKFSVFKIMLWALPLLAIALGIGVFASRRISDPVAVPEPTPVTIPAGASNGNGSPLPVRVVQAKSGAIQEWVHSDGSVSAVRGKHLRFEVPGTITYIKKVDGRDLREGDYVYEGELLAQIDDRKLQADLVQSNAAIWQAQEQQSVAMANLAQTKANLGQAQATVEQLQANVAQAKAKLGQVRAGLAQAEARKQASIANVREAKANLEARMADRDLAEVELRRRQELYDEGVISASDRDVYQNKLDNAKSAVNATQSRIQAAEEEVTAAESNIQATEQDIAAAESQVRAAESQVRAAESQVEAVQGSIAAAAAQVDATSAGIESARAQSNRANVTLEDTEIRAPFDGMVAFLNIREGDYWSPQQLSSQTAQNVVETVPIILIDPNEFEVQIELPAFDGTQVSPGQTAFVVLDEDLNSAYRDSLNNETLISVASAEGEVFSVSPSVTPGGRAVNVKVRINRINPEKRDRGALRMQSRLRNGARVSAWIAVKEAANTTVIPANVIVYRDQKPFVFVVQEKDGKQFVEQRPVTIGIKGISQQEILEGIKPGDRLVTDGKNLLVNNAPVDVVD